MCFVCVAVTKKVQFEDNLHMIYVCIVSFSSIVADWTKPP